MANVDVCRGRMTFTSVSLAVNFVKVLCSLCLVAAVLWNYSLFYPKYCVSNIESWLVSTCYNTDISILKGKCPHRTIKCYNNKQCVVHHEHSLLEEKLQQMCHSNRWACWYGWLLALITSANTRNVYHIGKPTQNPGFLRNKVIWYEA